MSGENISRLYRPSFGRTELRPGHIISWLLDQVSHMAQSLSQKYASCVRLRWTSKARDPGVVNKIHGSSLRTVGR